MYDQPKFPILNEQLHFHFFFYKQLYLPIFLRSISILKFVWFGQSYLTKYFSFTSNCRSLYFYDQSASWSLSGLNNHTSKFFSLAGNCTSIFSWSIRITNLEWTINCPSLNIAWFKNNCIYNIFLVLSVGIAKLYPKACTIKLFTAVIVSVS